jgi:uncharacterized metal-binding protein YceD (DUF177 family)
MGKPLRERRTAAEWAASRQVIEIADKVSEFPQLEEAVEADLSVLAEDARPSAWRESRVTGRLRFGFADAEQRLPTVDVVAQVTVDAVCQRCLEVFGLLLAVDVKLLLLDLDDEAEGYDELEVWEMQERLLRPQDIVEELLVMAMPFAAKHTSRSACKALTSPSAAPGEEDMTTPFAALRRQMAQDNEGSAE